MIIFGFGLVEVDLGIIRQDTTSTGAVSKAEQRGIQSAICLEEWPAADA